MRMRTFAFADRLARPTTSSVVGFAKPWCGPTADSNMSNMRNARGLALNLLTMRMWRSMFLATTASPAGASFSNHWVNSSSPRARPYEVVLSAVIKMHACESNLGSRVHPRARMQNKMPISPESARSRAVRHARAHPAH